jgi:hypothetical protein
VQFVTGNKGEERKTTSQKGVETTILRSKKEWSYYRGTRDEFTDTISGTKKGGTMLKMIKGNHNKVLWFKFCMGKLMLEGQ